MGGVVVPEEVDTAVEAVTEPLPDSWQRFRYLFVAGLLAICLISCLCLMARCLRKQQTQMTLRKEASEMFPSAGLSDLEEQSDVLQTVNAFEQSPRRISTKRDPQTFSQNRVEMELSHDSDSESFQYYEYPTASTLRSDTEDLVPMKNPSQAEFGQ